MQRQSQCIQIPENRPGYTVTLNKNGGTVNSGNVTCYFVDTGATLPTNVTKADHTFGGWFDNEELTGTAVTSIAGNATGNKEYWAKWTANAPTAYTVTFVGGDGATGTAPTQADTAAGGTFTLPANSFTKTGYIFAGWNDGTNTYAAGSTYTMPARNVTFTAQWTADESIPTDIGDTYADTKDKLTALAAAHPTALEVSENGGVITLKLLKDVAGRIEFAISNGTFIIDTNGKTFSGGSRNQAFSLVHSKNVTATLTGNGSVTSGAHSAIYLGIGSKLLVESATITGKVDNFWGGSAEAVVAAGKPCYSIQKNSNPPEIYTVPTSFSCGGSDTVVVQQLDELPTYTVTVTNGTGGGYYALGSTVTIVADSAPAGQVFDKWVVTGADVADATAATTTFTMPANAVTAEATYKAISAVAVTGVSLSKTSTTLTVGGTETLTATVTPDDAIDKSVTWTSGNESVATVDSNGKITARAAGTAVITVKTTDGNFTATCTVTVNAASDGGSGGGGGGSSSAGSTGTTTSKNPDGSTTTTTTDKNTGTVTETTKNTDGSTTTVETKKDGSVTETQKNADGTTGTVKTDASGNVTEVTVTVPGGAVKNDEPVTLPIEVPAADSSKDAAEIKVDVPSKGAVVEIPVTDVTPGTVVVIVDADGSETVVSTTALTEDGVVVKLEKDATVKVVDNAKEFADVPATSWAKDAVDFASARGITGGTSDTAFSPNASCTRAQMVTFLWRAAGSPEPVGSSVSFADVDPNAYYAKAVQWAYEQGITGGTSDTTFSPDAICTRAQMATFLWRNAGALEPVSASCPFADVASNAYYAKAVQWAYERSITNGTSATVFGANADCTRAQMVTFLYRYFVK